MDTFEVASSGAHLATHHQSSAAMQNAARDILRVRKAAKSYFGTPVRSEAAWNVMLALYARDRSAAGRNIGSVAERADIPRSTTLRWLLKLERHGFVSLSPDKADKRAISVQLTREGREAMQQSFVAAQFTN